MTKQEIYDALVAKFDAVQPLDEWSFQPWSLGFNRADVVVKNKGEAPKTYTLEEDSNGDVVFAGKNPTLEKEVVISFGDRVDAEIQSRKSSGQIVDAIVSEQGNSSAEIIAYIPSGDDVTRQEFFLFEKDDETIGFVKIV